MSLYPSPYDAPFLPLIHCLGTSCPTLPPKPAYISSFEKQIIDKVHKDLVLRKHPPPPNTAACSSTQRSTLTTPAPSLRLRVASALAKTDLGLSLPLELVDDVIVTGTKHKMQILQDYEGEFGADFPKSIITREKGKHSHGLDNVTPLACCPPSKNTIGSKN